MADNNSNLVTAGKPKVGGAVFRAPIGTTLPTDAITALASGFQNVGYISEDGVTNGNSKESEKIKDWGGVTVLTITKSKETTYKFTMIESMNKTALQTYYGDEAVTGTDLDSGLTVKNGADDDTPHIYVVEQIAKGGVLHRTVIPSATVSETEDIEYKGDNAVGLGVTLACEADSDGYTNYEYLQKPPAQTPGE